MNCLLHIGAFAGCLWLVRACFVDLNNEFLAVVSLVFAMWVFVLMVYAITHDVQAMFGGGRDEE